jgi:hypothetical protein
VDLTKPNQNITFKVGATNFELQRAIEAALPAAVAQTKDLAKNFKGSTEKETCSKIFNFLKNNIQYKVDGDNQKIKLPSAFLREKSGDCKSYSLFTAAILSNLKIPFSFTYASYNPTDKTPEHIYVTTKNGCIIDAVWGKFNSEKKPCYKYHKPMNISYISGIKKSHSEKYEKREEKYHNIGNIFGKNHSPKIGQNNYRGLGRTGWDWAAAVGIDKNYNQAQWWLKNVNIVLAPARFAIKTSLSKNGGGLANYLWTLSPFNDTDKEDTTKKALYFGEMEIITRDLMKKYNVASQKSAYNPTTGGTVITTQSITPQITYNGPLTVQYTVSPMGAITPSVLIPNNSALTKSQVTQSTYTRELEAAKLKVYAKYPYIISRKSTPKMHEAYRKLETWYFWEMGGTPDDLNDAIKEGNQKTPTGETFNYYIQQRLNGRDLGIGLGLRASISALFGYKYDPTNKQIIDPTTNKPINGVKKGIGDGGVSAIIVTILAWIAKFPIWMQFVLAIILLAVGTILTLALFAPQVFNSMFGINTNGATVTPDPIDPKLKQDMLDESQNSWTDYLVPAGIAAAVLLYAN